MDSVISKGLTMDPFSLLGVVAPGAAKGIGSVAGKQVAKYLGKRTQRIRVARAVSKRAATEDITVSGRQLNQWLKADDVRLSIAAGDSDSLRGCAHRLTLEATPDGLSPDRAGAQVLQLVLDESLRRMSAGDAEVASTRRLEHAIHASEERILLASGGDEAAFLMALGKLHPWRATEAVELAERWTRLRALVITLVGRRERRSLLQNWTAEPPHGLADAPAEVWCWFACVAADYGASEAAVALVSKGVEHGADPSYWWARAGLIIGTGTTDDTARAQELWRRSVPKHTLAAAGEAITVGNYTAAEELLDEWKPQTPNDRSIKSILQAAAAAGRGDLNRAIAIGLETVKSHPEGSGNALRTAEALLTRGHNRQSDHPLDDFARAYRLAIAARDSRRSWLGDSVAPILTAVKASALATDTDLAWKLTQQAPEGTALEHEARDKRLRRESAMLAATMGRLEHAQIIARGLGDPFVTHTVEGWAAFIDENPERAEAAWLSAWASAPDDTARLQTAAALAPLGRSLPDLDLLPEGCSQAIQRIRTVHEVMSTADSDMSLLRARASNSEELTVVLAERLVAQDKPADAAGVLEAGATRWNHALMMKMAASRYMAAGCYQKANDVAATALSMGGPAWAGRLECLSIQFDALESLGEFQRSLPLAREMAAMVPANLTIRWALVHSLARAGRIPEAWAALTYNGQAAEPRNAGDAQTWIGLAAQCDDSVEFVKESLEMMNAWQDEPDLVGVFLAQIYSGLRRHERDVADADIAELHKATNAFTEAHPDNAVFRKVTLDENDLLGSLAEILKEAATEDPALKDIRERVERGEFPLGLLAECYRRPYVEASIKRGAGSVFSHHPPTAYVAAEAAAAALGASVVIDGTAAVTLSLLELGIVDQLLGAFLTVETTDSAYRDALASQDSLNMLSTMTLGWDVENQRPLITETDEAEAQALSRRADRVVELLSRSERRGWPGLKRFAKFGGEGAWLSALDFALSEERAFWCDDRSLRQLAASEGAQTFGTVDLIAALVSADRLTPDVAAAVQATLIAGFHVDFDFDADVMELAAEIGGWQPKGAAIALSRAHSWRVPADCLRFASDAMALVATDSPSALAGWTWAAAVGLVRITGGNVEGASENIRILLSYLTAQSWLRPDTFPFVMQGIRTATTELPGVTDPLRTVIERIFAAISEKHGASQAAEFIMMLVANLDETDRLTAAEAILTSGDIGSVLAQISSIPRAADRDTQIRI
ncbi:PIN domain-containing protein [Luteimicrobium sp. DT211]|uniref:PIN domain-containing protein n=1 Tax=Luteimicrobium sp. DT211 TaxID=3393412 RepID=UPI003CFB127B